MIQDTEGYIWFITDNGVSRYDGYTFRNFGVADGLNDNVILQVHQGANGELWFVGMTGRIYIYRKGKILPYAYNDIIQKYPVPTTGVDVRLDTLSGSVLVGYKEIGALRVDSLGHDSFLTLNGKRGIFFSKIGNIRHAIFDNSKYLVPLKTKVRIDFDLYWESESGTTCFDSSLISDGVPISISVGLDSVVIVGSDDKMLIVDGKIVRHVKVESDLITLKSEQNGAIWECMNNFKRVIVHKDLDSFFNGTGTVFFDGKTITSVLKDRESGVWVSTLYSGVWYYPDFKMRAPSQPKSLGLDNIIKIFSQKNTFYALSAKGKVFDVRNNSVFEALTNGTIENKRDLIYSEAQGKIYIGKKLKTYKKGKWGSVGNYRIKKLKLFDDSNTLFVSFGPFILLNTENDSVIFRSNKQALYKRFYTIEQLHPNHFILGSSEGLYSLKDKKLQKLEGTHPVYNQRIEDSGVLSDSTLVFGTKGLGVVFMKGDSVLTFSEKNGLIHNMVENVFVDATNRVWVGTLSGLSCIYKDEEDNYQCRNLNVANGLPSNEINDILVHNDTLWVATSKGMVHMPDRFIEKRPYTPILRNILINGEKSTKVDCRNLDYFQNNIEVAYFSPMLYMSGDILYRYRTQEHKKWTETKNTAVIFSNLAPGDYRLEVQAQNQSNQWSNSSVLEIHITPPLWERWYFYLFAALALSGGIFAFFANKLKQSKKEKEIQSQMFELERAAMQAQMDPHFLFNALNSIQSLIAKDDKVSAMNYLATFSSLMRFNLENSIEKTILLKEEIVFLKKYLELETLRATDSFSFSIQMEASVEDNKDFIKIPPMLIQPLVENAIKHGMKSRDKDGLIEVFLTETGDFLEVTVKDNGLNRLFTDKKEGHNSFGTELIQRRLELLVPKEGSKVEFFTLKQEESDGVLATVSKIKIL